MQIVLNGFISGLAIALLAVAFQMVYLPTKVFFLSLAGLFALAPYVYLVCQQASAPWILSAFASLVVVILLALSFEKFNHAPLTRKGASSGAHLISSLGIYIVMVQLVAIVWGNETKTLRSGLDSAFQLAGAVLTWSQISIAGISIVLLTCFVAMLRGTDVGLRLRALADNPTQFALYGYNVYTHRLIAFGFSGLLAAIVSLLVAHDLGFDPYAGLHAVLLAVVAVIIGGRTSFLGPIFGGILLGVVRAQVVWHLSGRWQEPVTFSMLALFLLVRPQGLFGQKTRIEGAL